MKKYVGTKEILAMPMGYIEFTQYMSLESEAMDNREGYLVEYLDSPNGNHPSHSNYVSWSPKDVFERAYRPSGNYIERLKIELHDLLGKASRLDDFINGIHSRAEMRGDIDILETQLKLMKSYADILKARLVVAGSDGGSNEKP